MDDDEEKKRLHRQEVNREAARKSRKRKQKLMEELQERVVQLKNRNQVLRACFIQLLENYDQQAVMHNGLYIKDVNL
ncbi:hypothetical protein QQ045_014361 [Rhodiola kirilowii]